MSPIARTLTPAGVAIVAHSATQEPVFAVVAARRPR